MKAVLTAVVAAIEAAAVAVAVYAVIAVLSVLVWWLVFDLGADPSGLIPLVASLWQLVHFVPMPVLISAPTALNLGLPAEAFSFTLSLAPLGLTLVTALLAFRSGWRFAGRTSGGWSILGAAIGLGAAASVIAASGSTRNDFPLWTAVVVPTLVYVVPLALAVAWRSALDSAHWWVVTIRGVQRLLEPVGAPRAAAFPARAAETTRLAAAGLASLLGLGALGVAFSLLTGYVDIITLSQSLRLDAFGSLMLFFGQLALLPIAWIWSVSWFAGTGFSVGMASTLTPFDTLVWPLPSLPLLGALPEDWGVLGGLAPAMVVALGAALGGLAGGRPLMRRASVAVSVTIPIAAAALVGLVSVCMFALASGSIGPGRLAVTGADPWATGALLTLELAFGMSLGVFARRFDVDRMRAVLPGGVLRRPEQSEQVSSLDESRMEDVLAASTPTPMSHPEASTPAADPAAKTPMSHAEAETPPLVRATPPSPDAAHAEPEDALLTAFSWEHRDDQFTSTTPPSPSQKSGARWLRKLRRRDS